MKKAIQCIKNGAYDYINKPYEFEELVLTVNRAIEHRNLLGYYCITFKRNK
jgi:DNA-binding NtrC family response regulator